MLALATVAVLLAAAQGGSPSFKKHVAPILARCVACHGEAAPESGYALHTFERLLEAGDSAKRPIVPGKPRESELYRRLVTDDVDSRMPPETEAPLSKTEIATIARWIRAGAPFDGGSRTRPWARQPSVPAKAARQRGTSSRPVPVFALAFLQGGKRLAVGGYRELTVWELETGKLARRVGGLPKQIHSLAVAPDGKSLAVGGGSPGVTGQVRIVALSDWSVSQPLLRCSDVVLGICFAPGGRYLALGGADRVVRLVDAASGKEVWASHAHSDWVTDVGFQPDGKLVASASRDHTVKCFDAATGRLYTTYTRHKQRVSFKPLYEHEVYALAFDPRSTTIVTGGEGRRLHVWNPAKNRAEDGTAAQVQRFLQRDSHVRFLDKPDVKTYTILVADNAVFSAGEDGIVRMHDLRSKKLVRELEGHHDCVYALAWNSGKRRLASAGQSGTVLIWDVDSGKPVRSLVCPPPGIHR